MSRGRVKWFNDTKGFGFIVSEEGEDVFVHYSQIQGKKGQHRTLTEDQEVEFDVERGPKGLFAENVTVLA